MCHRFPFLIDGTDLIPRIGIRQIPAKYGGLVIGEKKIKFNLILWQMKKTGIGLGHFFELEKFTYKETWVYLSDTIDFMLLWIAFILYYYYLVQCCGFVVFFKWSDSVKNIFYWNASSF